MLESTISAPVACSCAGVTPFTVASVPTGMKRGVVTTPWGVWKQPQRALVRVQRAVISKWKLIEAAGSSGPIVAGRPHAQGLGWSLDFLQRLAAASGAEPAL